MIEDLIPSSDKKPMKELTSMHGYSSASPAEVIAEYIPTEITVVKHVPTEDAKLGFHCVVPIVDAGIEASTYDMRRLLHHVYTREGYFSPMRSVGVFESLYPGARIKSLTPAQLDDIHNRGYNPLRYVSGNSVVLYGTHIATVDIDLNDVVGFHKFLLKLVAVANRVHNDCRYEPLPLQQRYLLSSVEYSLRELVSTQEIFNYKVSYYYEQQQVDFQIESSWREPLRFEITFDGMYIRLHTVGPRSSAMLRVLKTLNPTRFTGPALGVDDIHHAFYRPDTGCLYGIILFDESVSIKVE